jgi:hypothetical protein
MSVSTTLTRSISPWRAEKGSRKRFSLWLEARNGSLNWVLNWIKEVLPTRFGRLLVRLFAARRRLVQELFYADLFSAAEAF